VLPKEKDKQKMRPLVSYYHHPWKRIFNASCRAILFLLAQLRVFHLNLFRTQDFNARMNDILQQLRADTYGEDTAFIFQPGDIKNMYTEIKHELVQRALMWLFDHFTHHRHHRILSVRRFGRRGVEFGRTADTEDFIHLTLDDVAMIVDFDLRNSIFSVGARLFLQQSVGLPMGSPNSPALAVLVCVYFEYHFHVSLGASVKLFNGVRYMDDNINVAAYKKGDDESKKRAVALLQRAVKMYDEKMIVEVENIANDEFTYLDHRVAMSADAVAVRYYNKNSAFIAATGRQKYFKYQHWYSNHAVASKRGVVLAILYRIQRSASSAPLVVASAMEFLDELLLLKYPVNLLAKCVAFIHTKLLRLFLTAHTNQRNDYEKMISSLRQYQVAWSHVRQWLLLRRGRQREGVRTAAQYNHSWLTTMHTHILHTYVHVQHHTVSPCPFPLFHSHCVPSFVVG
jgi:hypothetical protein